MQLALLNRRMPRIVQFVIRSWLNAGRDVVLKQVRIFGAARSIQAVAVRERFRGWWRGEQGTEDLK